MIPFQSPFPPGLTRCLDLDNFGVLCLEEGAVGWSGRGGEGVRRGLWNGLREGLGVPLQINEVICIKHHEVTSPQTDLTLASSSFTARENPSFGVAELEIFLVVVPTNITAYRATHLPLNILLSSLHLEHRACFVQAHRLQCKLPNCTNHILPCKRGQVRHSKWQYCHNFASF